MNIENSALPAYFQLDGYLSADRVFHGSQTPIDFLQHRRDERFHGLIGKTARNHHLIGQMLHPYRDFPLGFRFRLYGHFIFQLSSRCRRHGRSGGHAAADSQIRYPLRQRQRLLDGGRFSIHITHMGIDGHKRRIFGQEIVFETKPGDFLDTPVIGRQFDIVRQRGDPMPGPEIPDRGIGGGRFGGAGVDSRRIGLIAADTGQPDRAGGRSFPFAEEDDRPLRQHIGDGRRLHIIRLKPFEFGFDLGQHRRLHIFSEFFRLGFGVIRSGDHEGLPHARPCDTFHQKAVDRRANPESEHVGTAQILPDHLEGILFHIHIAVGCNDDGAGAFFITGKRQGAF